MNKLGWGSDRNFETGSSNADGLEAATAGKKQQELASG